MKRINIAAPPATGLRLKYGRKINCTTHPKTKKRNGNEKERLEQTKNITYNQTKDNDLNINFTNKKK